MKPREKDRKRFLRRRRSRLRRAWDNANLVMDEITSLLAKYRQRAVNQAVAMNADTLPPPP